MSSRILMTAVIVLSSLNYCKCDEPIAVNAKINVTKANYRLPRSLSPETYKLQIFTHLNDAEIFKFYGDVQITINVIESTKNITLHAKNLNITTGDIRIHSSLANGTKCKQKFSINYTEFQMEHDFFIVHTNEVLEQGCQFELFIPFGSDLSNGLLGYYRSSYTDKQTNGKRWISVTQFEPIHARSAFPCFDEPNMKAKFDISLGHHKNFTALSNMPMITSNVIANKPDWILDKFDITVPMSTYLVAYSINDFEYQESDAAGDVRFRVWSRRDAVNQVEYAKVIGPKVLQFYEKTFNVKYPLPKIDLIAIPDFGDDGMENWGLITFMESKLLYLPNFSLSESQHHVASVVAHELAHQWFGNLVTMRWWTDLWLNEGFATYVASLGVRYLHPEWNSFDEDVFEQTDSVFKFDALKSSHPLSVQIDNPNQITTIFDEISYDKGSSIIRMLHLFLGHETFFGGINNYLNEYRYQNADQDNLWDELTKEAHRNEVLEKDVSVKGIMDSWTLQTGYPIVDVTRNYENNSAIITQYRFLIEPSEAKKLGDSDMPCWWIPLSYTTEQELDFDTTEPKTWLRCDRNNKSIKNEILDLTESDKWMLFNIQIAGLYRIRYDENNWNLLIRQLTGPKYTKISTLNRAALINDAFDLAWSGDQDYSIALRLIKYLEQEKEYLPWSAALKSLSAIDRMLKRTSQYGPFKSYIQRILHPIYQRMGGLNAIHNQNDRSDLTKLWACRFDVDDCQKKAKSLFLDWMSVENPEKENPVPLDLRPVIYSTAIRHGGDREWEFLWERYRYSNVGAERSVILNALGCSREVWLLQRYLGWTLNETSGVRNQDCITVFGAVSKNDVGLPLAKSFLFENVDVIYQNTQTKDFLRYINPLIKEMVFKREYDDFEAFFRNRKEVFSKIPENVEQALEIIRTNNKWHERNYDSFGRLLDSSSSRNNARSSYKYQTFTLCGLMVAISLLLK